MLINACAISDKEFLRNCQYNIPTARTKNNGPAQLIIFFKILLDLTDISPSLAAENLAIFEIKSKSKNNPSQKSGRIICYNKIL